MDLRDPYSCFTPAYQGIVKKKKKERKKKGGKKKGL